MTDDTLQHFDDLFGRDEDPWRYRSSWYEERKRRAVLAALPERWYASAYEPGCANGELSAALALRCGQLHASDGSAAAVDIARRRLATMPDVKIDRAVMPADWPHAQFDLIVLSELGYYLNDADQDRLITQCAESLTSQGTLLACHSRLVAGDFHRSGDAVHAAIASRLRWPRLVEHVEADFVLDVWSPDERSVARREGVA